MTDVQQEKAGFGRSRNRTSQPGSKASGHNLAFPMLVVARKALRPFGLDVVRIGAMAGWLDRDAVTDPLTHLYFSDMRHAPLVRLHVADARLGATGYRFNSGNPFTLAFARAASAPDEATAQLAVRAVLADYYDTVRPKEALSVLSLSAQEAPGLAGVAAQNFLLPWGSDSIEERAWRLKLWAFAGSLANYRQIVLPGHGMTDFGPVSAKKLELEVQRVVALDKSLKAKGFCLDKRHPLEVVGLRSGRDYRWLAMRGRHRFAACAAWGIGTVEARVTKIIRREDVSVWPRVVSGTFTKEGALQVFDRLFDGKPPACALNWAARAAADHHPSGGEGRA